MAEAGETADIQARLDALRASGAAEREPIRFAYLEALARRAATQAEPVRRSLHAKISAAARELASCLAPVPPESPPTSSASPLADLLAYIGQHVQTQQDTPQLANAAAMPQGDSRPAARDSSAGRSRQSPELKSVAYFRDEWSKLSAEQQLTQTLAQAPENAGPMNSQHLVLRSLQVMRDIAPDYLHGFMSYIDALIWLEHAAPARPATARAAGSEGAPTKRAAKSSLKNR
ncbi:MAG TPA: DUF2894 domain-containing protein [Azonexus sp.]